jgi:hypothetical protein
VASAGDVNGDGFSDVMLGVPLNEKAELFYGNGVRGRVYAPVQIRADGTARISLLGRSESTTSFRVFTRAWTPAGRSRVRLQWEAKPLGTPFNGVGVRQGGTIDTNPPIPGAGSQGFLGGLVDQLTPATAYRWRLRVAGDSRSSPGRGG